MTIVVYCIALSYCIISPVVIKTFHFIGCILHSYKHVYLVYQRLSVCFFILSEWFKSCIFCKSPPAPVNNNILLITALK